MSTFAEWLPTGRITPLGDSAGVAGAEVTTIAVAGRFAAYGLLVSGERYPETGIQMDVVRLNVQSRQRTQVGADGAGGGAFGPKSPGVTDVVSTPAGSVGWTIAGSFLDPTGMGPPLRFTAMNARAVYVMPGSASRATLAALSPLIEATSLAAIPGHIYWLEGGVPRTFAVP